MADTNRHGFFNAGDKFKAGRGGHGNDAVTATEGQKTGSQFLRVHPNFRAGRSDPNEVLSASGGEAKRNTRSEFFKPHESFTAGKGQDVGSTFKPATNFSPTAPLATSKVNLPIPAGGTKGTASMSESKETLARTAQDYAAVQGALMESIAAESRKPWHGIAFKAFCDLIHGKPLTIGPITRAAIGKALNEPVDGLDTTTRKLLQGMIAWGLGGVSTDAVVAAIKGELLKPEEPAAAVAAPDQVVLP